MTNYFNTMDRGYHEDDNSGLYANEIGFTTIPTQDQLEELKSKIKLGASKVELGFMGAQKSNPQQPSPESYGNRDREAMRELAKINEVELTTHATTNIPAPLSGLNKQEGKFSDSTRDEAKQEIKRAIDFAADVSEGGPVVTHMGEFPRAISQAEKEVKEGEYNPFQEHKSYRFDENGEIVRDKKTGKPYTFGEEENVVYLANQQTGELIDQVKKDQPIYREKVKRDENNNIIFDKNGKPIPLDGDGNRLYFDDDSGKYYKLDERGNKVNGEAGVNEARPAMQKWDWQDIEAVTKQENKHKSREEQMEKPEHWYFRQRMQEQISQLNGRIAQEKRFLQEAEKNPDQAKNHRDSIKATEQQIAELKSKINNAQPVEEVAASKSAQSLAELGVYAYEKEQKKNLEKPLYVSPENIFPEEYGGHPDELKKMIKQGRNYMTEMLKEKKKMNEKDAKKVADNHIKATFDIGHAYTWKRYFNGTDKEFNEWFANKVKNLQENGYIGHVHVSDNFGYYDEHVSPGQGDAPIKETVDKLKKKGVDFVVEAGKGGDKDWMRSLEELGKPVYGLSRPYQADSWTEIRGSYAGKTPPPYFLAQPHAEQLLGGERIKQDFSSWADIPFE